MEGLPPLVYIIGGLIAVFIVFKLFKSIMKVALSILVVGGLIWYFTNGSIAIPKGAAIEKLFENTTVTELLDTYCTPEKADKAKCKCIVTPVYNDLNFRLSKEQISQLETDPTSRRKELRKSLIRERKTINTCLKEKAGKGLEWMKTVKEILEATSGIGDETAD